MKIQSLYFKNGYLGWEISRIKFQNLNLLVGLSGAGKSQIISALWHLRSIALGQTMNNVEWDIRFSIGEEEYVWKGSFATTNFDTKHKIKTESIRDSSGAYIERRADGLIDIKNHLVFGTQTTTRSTTPEGLLFQIYNSVDTALIVNHFKMMNLRDHTESQADIFTGFYSLRFRYASISRRLFTYLNVEQPNKDTEGGHIAYKIKINGQRKFIPHRNIASGMLRAFNIIADLYLSNLETVFLVDEFENSLGHNCLPNLEKLLLEHSIASQFILTSHHPDIINKISKDNWIIIERTNGAIHNRPANNLPFSNSTHEPYLILTNHFDRQ
jgi:predicted ATPase